jgi:hypothetical protein
LGIKPAFAVERMNVVSANAARPSGAGSAIAGAAAGADTALAGIWTFVRVAIWTDLSRQVFEMHV